MWTKNFKPPSLFSSTIVKSALSHFFLFLFFSGLFNGVSYAADIEVNDVSELVSAISSASNGDKFVLSNDYDPKINSDMTIEGNGHTIDASGCNCTIFDIGSGANVKINQLVLKNGKGKGAITKNGGAIYNEGTLTIKRSSFINNIINGNGGAIYNVGNLTITNSTFSGNSASLGGGIHNNNSSATIDITNCTFFDNNATNEGNAIRNESGSITIRNSIIVGNTATEPDIFNNNPATPNHATLSSNGYNIVGNIKDNTNNFEETTGDQIGEVLTLNSLTNGYYPLQSDSPALNAIPNGTNGCGDTINQDQRGITRPQGGKCDIGAYEFEYFSLTLNKDGDGNGTVGSDETDGIDCGSNCTKEYPKGTSVTLTETADSYSTFDSWSAGCTSPLTINSNTTCTATFNATAFTLQIKTSGDGTVSTNGTATGNNCGTNCTEYTYNSGASVSLTPTPNSGSTFKEWQGEGCQETFTIDSHKKCTAVFETQPQDSGSSTGTIAYPLPRELTISVEVGGTGSGQVKSKPGGINCKSTDCTKVSHTVDSNGIQCEPAACQQRFKTGSYVYFTVTPDSDSEFSGWGGTTDCLDNKLWVTGHKYCVAYFKKKPVVEPPPEPSPAEPSPPEPSQPVAQLINLSTRAPIEGGARDIIAGFILRGTGQQKLLIRGFSLDKIDPLLTLQTYPQGEIIATNDNWQDDLQENDFPQAHLKPEQAIDAALLLELPVGAYTATLSSVNNQGLGLVSVDFIQEEGKTATAQLVNLSTRGMIRGGAGDIIAGFIIQGEGSQKVFLRGWGLESSVDPQLILQKYPSGDLVATNKNWQDDARANEIPSGMELPQITDAGLLLELPVGGYTVTLSSEGETGLGLVGIDWLD
jgi:hypothetical protein